MADEFEYRAVFSSPFGHAGSLGDPKKTLEEAAFDRPRRSEENFEFVSGVQKRKVVPWIPVNIDELLIIAEEKNARS